MSTRRRFRATIIPATLCWIFGCAVVLAVAGELAQISYLYYESLTVDARVPRFAPRAMRIIERLAMLPAGTALCIAGALWPRQWQWALAFTAVAWVMMGIFPWVFGR